MIFGQGNGAFCYCFDIKIWKHPFVCFDFERFKTALPGIDVFHNKTEILRKNLGDIWVTI